MTAKEILTALTKVNIVVIGDLILDHYIWGDIHRISPEAPVPVVHASRDTHRAGGAANVALNLAAMGAKASLIGTLGKDEGGDTLIGLLDAASISTINCFRTNSAPTIVKTRVIVRTQQLCRIDREASRMSYGIPADASFIKQLQIAIQHADAVVVSDYAKGVITQELLDQVLSLTQACGTQVAIDPKPTRRLAFKDIDLMTPNRKEALELAELPEPHGDESYPLEEVCRIIHEKYAPRILVVTLGADGMAVCQGGNILQILPTFAREVFDVTGAGDTVIASLTAALAAGADPIAAARFANIAAGVVVSKVGTATPSASEICSEAIFADEPEGAM